MPPSPPPERAAFNSNRQAIIAALGRKALDTTSINRVGRQELGAAWGGSSPQDRVRLKPHHYYVVNTDTHTGKGTHWVAVYTTATTAYIYDSYARNPRGLVHWLIRNIDRHGWKLGATDLDHHPEQIGYSSEVCGQDSLAWLLTVRDVGIRAARRI